MFLQCKLKSVNLPKYNLLVIFNHCGLNTTPCLKCQSKCVPKIGFKTPPMLTFEMLFGKWDNLHGQDCSHTSVNEA